jgi:hypothetical protein
LKLGKVEDDIRREEALMTQVSNQQTSSKSTDYPEFAPGEKVRTEFGELRTVWEQRGSQVFVVEEPDNASYDPTKLFRIATA